MSRRFVRCVLALYLAVLAAGSLMPLKYKVALHTTADHLLLHPIVHLAAFGVLAFLLSSLAKHLFQQCAALFSAIAVGVTLEVLQAKIYYQPLETADVALDSGGAILGFLVCYLLKIELRGT